MELQKKIKERWTESADGYSLYIKNELDSFKREAWEKLILEDKCNEKMDILDIGTGPGFFSIILSEQKHHRVIGIDCTEKMVNMAKRNTLERGLDIDFLVMDSHKLDFPDNSFDMIVNRNVTWTLYNPEMAYKEWKRVLKPGGKIIIFDANWQLFYFDEELNKKLKDIEIEYKQKYGEPFESCEKEFPDEFYKSLPLSNKIRPVWDKEKLHELGYKNIKIDTDIISKVYDEKEKLLYGATPLFKIVAFK